jgi:sugar phosphate isomerase/epimerase
MGDAALHLDLFEQPERRRIFRQAAGRGLDSITEDPMREFLISAVQIDTELRSGTRTVLDLAPLAQKHGARGAEYRDYYWKDKQRELPAVREQLSRLGLLAAYTTNTTLYNTDPALQAQLLRDIEDASVLGSPLLRVNLGARPTPDRAAPVREGACRAIEHAAHCGIRLALENNARPPGEQLSEIQEALQALSAPALGTNIDFANYVTCNQDPIAAIKALGPWIIYAHAKDTMRAGTGWKSASLGDGSLPLRDIFAALDATGANFLLCFEFPGEGDPDGAIARSKACLQRL